MSETVNLQIVDLAINADASERTDRASGTEKVLAPYPTINRLNSGRAGGIQDPTGKKVSSSRSSQESCRDVQRKNPGARKRMSRGRKEPDGMVTEYMDKKT